MTLFWKNFAYLCHSCGLSPNKWASENDFSSGAITNWKNGVIPRDKKLVYICKYFGVQLTDILNVDMEASHIVPHNENTQKVVEIKKDNDTAKEKGDNTITALSPKEKELLALVKRMSDSEIEQLRDFIYELYTKG